MSADPGAERGADNLPDSVASPPGDRPRDRRWAERREQLDEIIESAVEAEIETGHREETEAEAERNVVLRVIRVSFGVLVVAVGISLLVLPGPGLIVIAAGLALMAQDVPFARRWLDKVRERIPEDEDGGIATWVVVLSVMGLVLSISASLWFTFLR